MSGVDDRGKGSEGLGLGGVEGECKGNREGANEGVVEHEASDVQAQASVEGQGASTARGHAADNEAPNRALSKPGGASPLGQTGVEGQVGDSARGQATDNAAADAKLYALGSMHIYRGAFHKGLVGWPVVIVAVLRGEHSIHEQELVGALQPIDRFEVRPVIKDRLSWVSYDAKPNDLEPTGEVWGS